MTDPAGELDAVALDLHPPAPTVAELTPRHVPFDVLGRQHEPRGQALDDAGETGAVRLAGGCEDGAPRPS